MSINDYLIIIIPAVLLQLGLIIFSLKDLAQRKEFKYLPRLAWIIIIIFINIIGPLCYLALGRSYDHPEST
ncbi:MAG: PLDc N-terminal domain-containing protein [Spirochaetales bacterium]|nr:PLDc N-terminal domain-containing protein [Spirochaetales bacterium]